MKRAQRRHHLARMKAKAIKAFPDQQNAIKLANHMAKCSCHMCGNPRKHYKQRTRKEIA